MQDFMQAFKTSNHIVFERQTHLKQDVKATNFKMPFFSVNKHKTDISGNIAVCIIF